MTIAQGQSSLGRLAVHAAQRSVNVPDAGDRPLRGCGRGEECDYLDVLAELYAKNYWGQVSQWLAERRVMLTGHEWEETLLGGIGDLMRIQRHMPMPGIDSLWERGRSPRDFKETASVAHFLKRPFWCDDTLLGQRR